MDGQIPTADDLRRQSTFRQLQEFSNKLLSQLELKPLLESMASGVVEFLDADSGGIYLYDVQRGELDPVIHIRQPEEALYVVKPGEGMAGRVMQTRMPMKVDDYDQWPGRNPKQPRGIVGAVVQAPVQKGDEFLGVIFAERKPKEPPFSEEDLEKLQLFASQAAIAISNAQLYEEAKRAAQELSSLYETSLEITRQLDIPVVLERMIQRAENLVHGFYGQFYTFDKQRQVLVPAVPGHLPPALRTVNMKPGEGLSGTVFSTRKAMIINDYDAWENRATNTPLGLIRQAIAIPVEHGERILGVIALSRRKNDPAFNQDDLRLLTLFASQAAVAVANAQQYGELQQLYAQVREKESLESEIRVAHTIQSSLLPRRLPKIAGWDVAARWSAAKGVSGDFYDCFPVPGERWGFIIADVAGKGVPAAVFMAFCRTLVRTFCMDGRPPAEAIQRVNDLILADSFSEWFVTLFYGLLDPKQATLTYVNAGHPRPLLLRPGKKRIARLRADGIALGVVHGIRLEQKVVELGPGDLVLFYTDGMSEAMDSSGRLFEERRIQAALKKLIHEDPSVILNTIQEEIAAFSGGVPNDDLTAILLKRKAE
ncbi:MAG: SpoIIE family protein phosphatase [Anaerolineales bacterium]